MGKCISKPVAATAVDLPLEKNKPAVSQGATAAVKSSDRSLQHLFEKDVEEEEEANNGQLKRIPEEDSSGEEQEKPSEKPGSLETIPEDKSPDTEDESRKVVVVQTEKTVPVEVEKREVQLPVPTVVDKETVQVSPAGDEQVVTATVRPSTPEISESKSPPDEVKEEEQDVEIHRRSEQEQPLEGVEVREVPGRSKEVDEAAVEPLKEGEQVVEVDTQVVPEVSPREIQVNTDVVITKNTQEDAHMGERGEEAIFDVKEVHGGETGGQSMEEKDVKEVQEEQSSGHSAASEPGTEIQTLEAPLDVPAQGREVNAVETLAGEPIEDKLAIENGQGTEQQQSVVDKGDAYEGNSRLEEPRSDGTSTVPPVDVVPVQDSSPVTHAGVLRRQTSEAHADSQVRSSAASVDDHEAPSSLTDVEVPDVSSSAIAQVEDPEVPSRSVTDVHVIEVPSSTITDAEVPEISSSTARGEASEVPSSGVADADASEVPSSVLADVEGSGVPSSGVADVEVSEVPSSVTHTVRDTAGTHDVPGSSVVHAEVPEASLSATEVEVPEVPSSVTHKVSDTAVTHEVPSSSVAHAEVPEVPSSAVDDVVQVPETASSVAHNEDPEVPVAPVEAPEVLAQSQVAEVPSYVEDPSSGAKVEAGHVEVRESSKSGTNVEVQSSIAPVEAPDAPSSVPDAEVPQGPNAVAHDVLLETQGSEQEFFEASEQISDLEPAEEPKPPEVDQPKSLEATERDETTLKVDVPTEETKTNVPREDTVQLVEETKAEPSSTS